MVGEGRWNCTTSRIRSCLDNGRRGSNHRLLYSAICLVLTKT